MLPPLLLGHASCVNGWVLFFSITLHRDGQHIPTTIFSTQRQHERGFAPYLVPSWKWYNTRCVHYMAQPGAQTEQYSLPEYQRVTPPCEPSDVVLDAAAMSSVERGAGLPGGAPPCAAAAAGHRVSCIKLHSCLVFYALKCGHVHGNFRSSGGPAHEPCASQQPPCTPAGEEGPNVIVATSRSKTFPGSLM